MSTEVTLQIKSTGSNETELIAEQLGKNLRGGEVIELISDLGGGKTTFVRGLAKGMGSLDTVASPSFTLKREYYTQDLTLHHYDFYRLHEPGTIAHELEEALHQRDGVTVVEWGNIVEGVLPKKRLKVHFKPTGNTLRQLKLEAPEELGYLLEGIKT